MTHTIHTRALVLFCLALTTALLACRPRNASNSATANHVKTASDTIIAYLQARVQGDADKMARLSCPAWQAQAKIEAASLKALEPKLEGVSCKNDGVDDQFTLVLCQGNIVANYNGQLREMDVSHRHFKTLQSGNEWQMCGYK